MKSFGKPPAAVANVTSAVMVLLSPPNKIPRDKSWNASKIMMGKVRIHLAQVSVDSGQTLGG